MGYNNKERYLDDRTIYRVAQAIVEAEMRQGDLEMKLDPIAEKPRHNLGSYGLGLATRLLSKADYSALSDAYGELRRQVEDALGIPKFHFGMPICTPNPGFKIKLHRRRQSVA